MPLSKLAVVALGGNALLTGDQRGTIDEQESNAYKTCEQVISLIKRGYNLVITHGNGPQVGNVLLQHEGGEKLYGVPKMPMDICVAETQGSIGYILAQQLHNALQKEGVERDILAIITQVLVDKNDPAFKNPTKPVGPFYSKEEADSMATQNNWVFKEDPRKRGWRRVVASPRPYRIGNKSSIEKLARGGTIVITVGGGGIPMFYVEPKKLQGIDAVIDKDLASALLAAQINADEFFILTDVPRVCLNYNTPEEKQLSKITIAEAKQYLDEGHFAEGSMAPKIRAAVYFVENGGFETTITNAANLDNPSQGTRIVLAENI
jgi:carbamate kinase